MNKQILSILVIALFFISSSLMAHPGRLRGDKGHCDHNNKEYHYHMDGKVTGASKSKYNDLCHGEKSEKTMGKKESRKEKVKADKKDDNTKTTKEKKDSKKDKSVDKKLKKEKGDKKENKSTKKDKQVKKNKKKEKDNK